jgi:hypothetical protein
MEFDDSIGVGRGYINMEFDDSIGVGRGYINMEFDGIPLLMGLRVEYDEN